MAGELDIPEYFLCPISLQIMKDPVTAVTGITYDRESIELWLLKADAAAGAAMCPVTKQPLPRGSGLTPNHMLRKLIQAWCIANGTAGIDPPKPPIRWSRIVKLIRDVSNRRDDLLNLSAMKRLDELASESEENRRLMAEAGVAKAMVTFLSRSFKDGEISAVDRALRILWLTWSFAAGIEGVVGDDLEFIQSILWILSVETENQVHILALMVLKKVIEVANWSILEKLEPNFFAGMVRLIRRNLSAAATRAILHILITTSRWGRNKAKAVDAGAVFELIELELSKPEKKTTELIFCLLAQLCSCAEGRQKLLNHAAGIAVVAKRLLRVSPTTDDRVICVFESIARYAATRGVVREMLRVGGVAKLCMVLQADCDGYLKKKARDILRLHSVEWNNSPCIQVYLLTRDPR